MPVNFQPILGVAALVVVAFIGSIMGLFARELATELTVTEQVFLRSFMGAAALLLICRTKISFRNILRAPATDLRLVVARSLSFYVIAISLGTIAFVNGNYGTVAIVLALPMPAILSALVFRESASSYEWSLAGMAFVGAALTIYSGNGAELSLPWPLLCALLATIFMSFGILGQKRQSGALNNFEITFLMLVVATLVMGTISAAGALLHGASRFPSSYVLIIGAVSGVANVLFLLCSNFGVARVRGVVVNNLLALQPVFATAVGIFVYHESLSTGAVVGGILIVASALLIARRREGAKA